MEASSNTRCGYWPKPCALRFTGCSLHSQTNMARQVLRKDLIWTYALTEPGVRNHGQCKGLFSSLPQARGHYSSDLLSCKSSFLIYSSFFCRGCKQQTHSENPAQRFSYKVWPVGMGMDGRWFKGVRGRGL